ncbi:MAG: hypothetical protein M3O50_03295 [Myxococcota bacterium]|nr:hypothetical protein [Myxococcota bacterium]
MRRTFACASPGLWLWCAAALAVGCAQRAPPPLAAAPAEHLAKTPVASLDGGAPAEGPDRVLDALAGRGEPHAPPLHLPQDAHGREMWLAFVGPPEVAWGAWRVTWRTNGESDVEPTAHWPVGVRVVDAKIDDGIAYVLLESLGVLDQPAGLRAIWVDGSGRPSPFDASPMALSNAHDLTQLATREKPPSGAAPDRTAALISTLQAASASIAAMAGSFAAAGVDVHVIWQSLFSQPIGHLSAENAGFSPLGDRVLGIVRDTLAAPSCGVDACESWTARGRVVVRFASEGGRWMVRSVFEDAAAPRGSAGTWPPRVVEANSVGGDVKPVLLARARNVMQVLGEAPLSSTGGSIGIALTDLSPEVPVIVLREGLAVRVFGIDTGAVRAEGNAQWEGSFADLDGDGRTDVIVRMTGKRADGDFLSWTQAFVAPAPSVQVVTIEADLASALAVLDATTVTSAATMATAVGSHGVSRDEACRLLATARTPAGFRRAATPNARIMHFSEPGMPTWRPKLVAFADVAAQDVRGIDGHCAELECSPARPYCAWNGGTDSQHFWFEWRGGKLMMTGTADYDGE